MTVVVHWSVVVLDGRTNCIRFAEYDFAPMPSEIRPSSGIWLYRREESRAVAIDVPHGSKVVMRRRPETSQRVAGDELRLATYFNPYGLDAETAAWCAHYRKRGFRVLSSEEVMTRKKKDGGAFLLADMAEAGGEGPYGRRFGVDANGMVPAVATGEPVPERERLRSVVAGLAEEVIAPKRRELERYETAIRRAIELIQPDRGNFVGTDPMRALAVLRECLLPESSEVSNGSQ